MMKYLFCFLAVFSGLKLGAQCEAILPFTQESMKDIHDVYQFTFLNKIPKNKLDSLVHQAMFPPKKIDSNYYDWNNLNARIVEVIDPLKMYAIVDAIGALQTPEAFVILNLYGLLDMKNQGDLSLFSTFCANIHYFGGAVVINKYYLNSSVSVELKYTPFHSEVFVKCLPLREKYFKDILYCKRLQGDAMVMYEMSKIDPKPYDQIIEKILNQYLETIDPDRTQLFRDSVLIALNQLPVIHDATWDDCNTSTKSDTNRLGVYFRSKEPRTGEEISILRVYTLDMNSSGRPKLVNMVYSPNFISQTRLRCEQYER
ncbi:MAG: hypothetical protein ACOYLG_09335 [Chitinophagaceae bacterium]